MDIAAARWSLRLVDKNSGPAIGLLRTIGLNNSDGRGAEALGMLGDVLVRPQVESDIRCAVAGTYLRTYAALSREPIAFRDQMDEAQASKLAAAIDVALREGRFHFLYGIAYNRYPNMSFIKQASDNALAVCAQAMTKRVVSCLKRQEFYSAFEEAGLWNRLNAMQISAFINAGIGTLERIYGKDSGYAAQNLRKMFERLAVLAGKYDAREVYFKYEQAVSQLPDERATRSIHREVLAYLAGTLGQNQELLAFNLVEDLHRANAAGIKSDIAMRSLDRLLPAVASIENENVRARSLDNIRDALFQSLQGPNRLGAAALLAHYGRGDGILKDVTTIGEDVTIINTSRLTPEPEDPVRSINFLVDRDEKLLIPTREDGYQPCGSLMPDWRGLKYGEIKTWGAANNAPTARNRAGYRHLGDPQSKHAIAVTIANLIGRGSRESGSLGNAVQELAREWSINIAPDGNLRLLGEIVDAARGLPPQRPSADATARPEAPAVS